ncbi:hypothetical protein Tco_0954177 [Tanacetum coccineum]|uniref:RNA-directed DNA polymerase, eukaryota n=1 Tax=Tanacetum coccineum TaxID=301880 RepID=A0ABQ5E223_9ASTR
MHVEDMASSLGCTIMENKFRYLGVMVGAGMTRHKAWNDVILKLQSRLSKWKAKTLSIGGRLTLLKSVLVLGASPFYNMSIFKVPKGVLKVMESIRSNFFKGASMLEKKISWIAWDKVLPLKKKGSLGVSSYFALNRALLLKWVWRFEVLHRVCRWWEIDFQLWRSFSEWDAWFSSIRLPGSVKVAVLAIEDDDEVAIVNSFFTPSPGL